ncbi:MAG: class I SAM-dependent methyltransferase [Thermoplasmatota archaeon]
MTWPRRSSESSDPMKDPEELKNELSRVYDDIAPHFADSRRELWPPMKLFIEEHAPRTMGDLGCGTGRGLVFAAEKGCRCIGVDSSRGQLELARKAVRSAGLDMKVELLEGDLAALPVGDASLDFSIMTASLHHLPTMEERIKALEEAFRCTRKGGELQISVWTWDQERFRERHLSRIEGRREKDDLDGPLPGDVYVPWKAGVERLRFYHLYGPGELESEIEQTEWSILRSYFDGRNHWAECIKDP